VRLNQLLEGVEAVAIKGDRHIDISGIFYDSKQLRPGGLFFAIKGTKLNGLDFIDEAIERGAVCVVSESDFMTYKTVCKVLVKDARKACAVVANNFYERPSQNLNIVGITGTNGKTTTMYLIEAILKESGKRCATIGTISYNVGERSIPASNTTPSSIMLQMLLNDVVKAGIHYCAMEVSSHSLHQYRVDGIRYKHAIFTNLTSEHMDYHKDMDDYFMAKRRLFEIIGEGSFAISNIDDEYGKRVTEATKATILTYGIKNSADIVAYDIKSSISGSYFKVKTPQHELSMKTSIPGDHNIYNILAAVSFGISCGIEARCIEAAIRNFKGVAGRLQRVDCGQNFSVFVDYAHTDDALSNVLAALRRVSKKRIISVFGCGGDRDRTKRPRMGKVGAELSDFLVITSDNPRSEDPEAITNEIVKGIPQDFKSYRVVLDRQKAIETALNMAKEDDIVLIAGKGHETCQIFKENIIAFDDSKICAEILESKYAYAVKG
jgi:UDP-N-acetylmuramoyl-L-alanyl-D-glutamate--2,6-diaminopimelate ligase